MVKPEDFALVQDMMLSRAGVLLDEKKDYLVDVRLGSLARTEGYHSLDALLEELRRHPANGLARQVVESMLTAETSFFREVGSFEALRRRVLPELLRRQRQDRSLSVWSAACASGQEPYSMAMLLEEYFPELVRWDIRVLATDLSRKMVERTREGRYSQREVNRGLPARFLGKYFEQQGLEWQVRPSLRKAVEVRERNLLEDRPDDSGFDLILLRNVLIYLSDRVRRAVLGRVARALRPGGYLLLGQAESAAGLTELLVRTPVEGACFYQRSSPEGDRR